MAPFRLVAALSVLCLSSVSIVDARFGFLRRPGSGRTRADGADGRKRPGRGSPIPAEKKEGATRSENVGQQTQELPGPEAIPPELYPLPVAVHHQEGVPENNQEAPMPGGDGEEKDERVDTPDILLAPTDLDQQQPVLIAGDLVPPDKVDVAEIAKPEEIPTSEIMDGVSSRIAYVCVKHQDGYVENARELCSNPDLSICKYEATISETGIPIVSNRLLPGQDNCYRRCDPLPYRLSEVHCDYSSGEFCAPDILGCSKCPRLDVDGCQPFEA